MTPTPRLVPDRPSDELKRCPFCNSPAEFVSANDEDGRFAAVECIRCGAGSRKHYFCGEDARDHVKAAWNKRHDAAPPAEAPAERGAELRVLSSHLIGIASHIRACPAYRKLIGDAEYIEKAASTLAQLAAAPAAPATDGGNV